MADLFRDTFAGQIVRLVSGNHYLPYPEELSPDYTGITFKKCLSGSLYTVVYY
jgi:hypothetical protein